MSDINAELAKFSVHTDFEQLMVALVKCVRELNNIAPGNQFSPIFDALVTKVLYFLLLLFIFPQRL